MPEKKKQASTVIAGVACPTKEGREELLLLMRDIVALKMQQTDRSNVTRYEILIEALSEMKNRLLEADSVAA